MFAEFVNEFVTRIVRVTRTPEPPLLSGVELTTVSYASSEMTDRLVLVAIGMRIALAKFVCWRLVQFAGTTCCIAHLLWEQENLSL